MLKVFKLMTFLGIFGGSFSAVAQLNETRCEHKIKFLPQIHRNVIDPSLGTDVSEVSKSQFEIASLIQRQPEIPVFSEQIDEDLEDSNMTVELKTAAFEIKKIFPMGLPSNYADLSFHQKNLLSNAGADSILFLLGTVRKLHKVVPNRETQDQLFAKIQRLLAQLKNSENTAIKIELDFYLNASRERVALIEIKKYFASNPSAKSVYLIYGRNHDFRRHGDLFNSSCIE